MPTNILMFDLMLSIEVQDPRKCNDSESHLVKQYGMLQFH